MVFKKVIPQGWAHLTPNTAGARHYLRVPDSFLTYLLLSIASVHNFANTYVSDAIACYVLTDAV